MERRDDATPMVWDEHSHQGRTREQVAASYETLAIIFVLALAVGVGWILSEIGLWIYGLLK